MPRWPSTKRLFCEWHTSNSTPPVTSLFVAANFINHPRTTSATGPQQKQKRHPNPCAATRPVAAAVMAKPGWNPNIITAAIQAWIPKWLPCHWRGGSVTDIRGNDANSTVTSLWSPKGLMDRVNTKCRCGKVESLDFISTKGFMAFFRCESRSV